MFKDKFKLNEADAREIVAELISSNGKMDTILNEKIEDRFKNLKDIFLTKEDKTELLKETYAIRTDLEKSMRVHLYWTVGIGFAILRTLITFSTSILSRLPAFPIQKIQTISVPVNQPDTIYIDSINK